MDNSLSLKILKAAIMCVSGKDLKDFMECLDVKKVIEEKKKNDNHNVNISNKEIINNFVNKKTVLKENKNNKQKVASIFPYKIVSPGKKDNLNSLINGIKTFNSLSQQEYISNIFDDYQNKN